MFSIGKIRRLLPLLLGSIAVTAVACGGGEKTVIQTVVVEKAGETVIERVVETVIVEKQVAGKTVTEVKEVIVEKEVVVEKPVIEVKEVEKIVEKVVEVEKPVEVVKEVVVEKQVVQTVIVEKQVDRILVATPTPGGEAAQPVSSGADPTGTVVVVSAGVGIPHGDPQQCIPACGNEKYTMGGYETLLFVDEVANVVPRLAASWVVADDLSTVDFTLQAGVEFHDGWGTMTAEDVAWSFNRANPATNPDSVHDQAGDFKKLMTSMEAIDDLTVRMNVAELSIGVLRKTLSPFWQSMGIHSKKVFDAHPDGTADVLIGTGPFQFQEWTQDERAILNAVPGHWRKTPAMATVRILAIPEPAVRATMLRTGEADVAALDIKDIPALKAEGYVVNPISSWIQGIFYGGNYWEDKIWGTDEAVATYNSFTDNPWVGEYGNAESMANATLVREAMSRTIDRVGINTNVVAGLAFPAYVPMVSINSADYDDKWTVAFEPDKGRALLEEAGYADGFDVALWGGGEPGSGTGREITEAIAAGWQNELGLNVTLDATVYSAHRPKTVEFTFDQLQYRIARDTNTALTLDLPKGGHASTKSAGGSICAGNLIPKLSELNQAAVDEPDAEKRKDIAREVIDYLQTETWLETGVLESPSFSVYNGRRIREWPRPLTAFSYLWFNLEEAVISP